ncbi:MAG: hypothetical protein LBT27_04820 [Prevotellaceae bacterium]|jgi:C-terminal processing protease CtpA/Prc|nr:hypothetical protein [Prevotellaceae bacterium]
MKAKNSLAKAIFICAAVCSVAFISCEKSDVKSDNNYVNSWILDTMQIYYFWNEQIPQNPNKEQAPDDFFHSLLYKYSQLDGDRFSWIQENYVDLLNSLSGVSSGDIGFEYTLYRYNSTAVFGEVLYVKPGTNAKAQGVKRGDAFLKIDGTAMDLSNYQSLLQKNPMNITFAEPVLVGNNISFNNEKTVAITKAQYTENPVFFDSVYNENGKKIGYLVYNFFASDGGNNSAQYDKNLNAVFAKFKSAGIDNLIVDLRYNSGGSTTSATRLASMIVRSLNTNNIFYILRFNSLLEGYWGQEKEKFVSSINTENINNVGDNLQKICFITSGWTASASEMVISGIKPFMNDKIIIVGDTTVGKSYASVSFYNMNDTRNKWGLQPLIAKYTNGSGDEVPATGIIPHYVLNESSIMPKKQIGDPNEDLLKASIAIISGLSPTQKMQKATTTKNQIIIGTSINKKAYSNQAVLDRVRKN